MKQYLDLLQKVLNEGHWQANRTGIPTKQIDGAMLQFDLSKGFPAVTTKKLAFKAVIAELVGFIRGYTSAEQFRELGCKVWDQNANENKAWLLNPARCGHDDLGRVYGAQWRDWVPPYESANRIDQLANAIHESVNNPTSRRIIVNAWNPGELDIMALPPCHMMFQLLVDLENNKLSMCMYQRSCDLFLGIPFNIASYAALLHIIAAATNRDVGTLTMFLADVHIYRNHIGQVEEQLSREFFPLPEFQIDRKFFERSFNSVDRVTMCEPLDFTLEHYVSHLPIKAEMAV